MASKYSSSTIPMTLEENYRIIEELLSSTDDPNTKEYIEMIGEWATENSLQLTSDLVSFSAGRGSKTYIATARLSMIDPVSGLKINIFESAFEGNPNEKLYDPTYSPLNKEKLTEFLRQFRRVDPDFLKRAGIKNINIDSLYPSGKNTAPGVGGYFSIDRRDSIQLPLLQLNYPHSRGVGIRGAIIHEGAHAYDANVIGNKTHVGKPSIFTQYEGNGVQFPTQYAKDHYNDRQELPLWHRKSEVISTVVEQVESHSLRDDALMRDGTPATNYNDWAKDWSDLVDEAEKIIRG